MMKAIFTNGAELPYLNAIETEEFWGGSSRRTLTFTCTPDAVSIDALNEILSDAGNTRTLTLEGLIAAQEERDGETVETQIPVINIYEGYTLKLKIGIDKVLVQPESPDGPALYGDRLVFKLGKPTFIEQQMARLGIQTVAQ